MTDHVSSLEDCDCKAVRVVNYTFLSGALACDPAHSRLPYETIIFVLRSHYYDQTYHLMVQSHLVILVDCIYQNLLFYFLRQAARHLDKLLVPADSLDQLHVLERSPRSPCSSPPKLNSIFFRKLASHWTGRALVRFKTSLTCYESHCEDERSSYRHV